MAFSNHDVRPDTPINNFATLNPLFINGTETTNATSSLSLSEGNLKLTADSNYSLANGTFTMRTGKWYWETYINTSVNYPMNGITHGTSTAENSYVGYDPNGNVKGISYSADGSIYGDSNGDGTHAANNLATGLSTYTTGDIIGCFFDADIGSLKFFKNETLIRTESGINRHDWHPATSAYNSGINTVNFGQDPTFGGSKIPTKVYTDANGQGRFYYQPPVGALALCSRNIDNPKNVPSTYIVDETNTKMLTYNGNTEISTFSPYATDGYSMKFDGSNQRVDLPSNASYAIGGTENYSIECWIYMMEAENVAFFQTTTSTSGANGEFWFGVNSNNLVASQHGSGTYLAKGSTSLGLNRWYHVAAKRVSGTLSLYVNGVEETFSSGNATTHSGVSFIQNGASIGFQSSNAYLNGYITDIKFNVGGVSVTAGYSSPLTKTSIVSDSNTKLFISNAGKFKDTSGTAATPTLVNNPSIEAWSPYTSIDKQTGFELPATTNGGSVKLDGTVTSANRGRILIPESTDFDFGTGDFTIEFWAYFKTWTGNYTVMVDLRTAAGPTDSFVFGIDSSRSPYIYGANPAGGSAATTTFSTLTATLNSWNHIALVKNSTKLSAFLNGVEEDSTATVAWNLTNSGSGGYITIGKDYQSSADNNFNGNMTDLRIVKGKAVYTGAFTPPSGKLGLTQSAGTNISAITSGETKLLLQPFQPKSSVNSPVFNITDSYNKGEANKNLTYYRDTKVVDFSPYKGGSHGSFFCTNAANTNKAIESSAMSNFWSAGGNHTFECWIYENSQTNSSCIFGSAGQGNLHIANVSSERRIGVNPSNGNYAYGTTVIPAKVWTHVALVQYSGSPTTSKLFINGKETSVANGAGSTGGDWNLSGNLEIGAGSGGSSAPQTFDGFMADVRMVNQALYNGDFTPPYDELTAVTNTTLLLQPGKVADTDNEGAKDPDAFFKCVTYQGAGSSAKTINLGFNPDLLWFKQRTDTGTAHRIMDTVRGLDNYLASSSTDQEYSTNYLDLNTSDNNITLHGSTGTAVNAASKNFIVWGWKAGGSGASSGNANLIDTNATSSTPTISSIVSDALGGSSNPGEDTANHMYTPSAMSINRQSGFLILTYQGHGTNTYRRIPHGLNKKPDFAIFKQLTDSGYSWRVYHKSIGATHALQLETSNAAAAYSYYWNNTEPTDKYFTVNNEGALQQDGKNFVAYIWTEIPGFSAFGSYEGNGSADGPFVYTGFKPAWVMLKGASGTSSSTGNHWFMYDNQRPEFNSAFRLLADSSANENTVDQPIDILSNGFKVRNANYALNYSNGTYIYMAFAELPFSYARGR
tara:strand:- start:277 stop:4239 length:3963 start_codon:yes stop_codon:yes gene_type:complete